ncbi:MAG: cbb3-type cytochrome oxidase assembly protein CcoS [Gammaproteobacteria bacterium]|nr:cbb3-type cytochrome oxidase assembly protein CcoS [Gammaproteobacteria bacterium]
MEVIYGLIPSMIIIGIILVIILFWAIKSGQFDDLEGDAHRILMDEDLAPQKLKHQKQEDENLVSDVQSEKSTSSEADKTKESD